MDTEHSIDLQCKLNSCLFFSTAKLARELGRLADEAFRKIGLSPSHALILYMVNTNHEIQQKEIGELLHLTPSTITRLVDKLERKDYVHKQWEGKNVCLKATSKGLAQQEDIISSWNQLHDGYGNILTEEELVHFLTLSGKLLEKLTKASD